MVGSGRLKRKHPPINLFFVFALEVLRFFKVFITSRRCFSPAGAMVMHTTGSTSMYLWNPNVRFTHA